ncbi:MAG: metallophosphoesterase family protein [Burkholderiales bacterium]
MKICIVSDSHDRAEALARAVELGVAQGAQAVLHCGDIIGANTLRGLKRFGIPVHVVHGNNLGDPVLMARLAAQPENNLHYHGQDAKLTLGERSIFMVHYPEYGYAMACTGEWELVCCGHEHRAWIRQVANVRGGKTWLVNPGTVAGLGAPATYVLGDLHRMAFSICELEVA